MQFIYFRSGEQKRMLARCQFGMFLNNPKAGATFTYPLQGYSWRYAICRSYDFEINLDTQIKMFDEVLSCFLPHQDNIPNDDLYSDFSEQANVVTRLRSSDISCHYFLIIDNDGTNPGENDKTVTLADNSELWLNSLCRKVLTDLFKPYEHIAEQFPKPKRRVIP